MARCTVCATQKKLKFSSDCGTLVAWNANDMMGSSTVCVWQESGSWFGVGVFGRYLASSPLLIYLINKFYKFCTVNAIFKDNTAINYIIVQHKKGSLLSTLTDHITLVYKFCLPVASTIMMSVFIYVVTSILYTHSILPKSYRKAPIQKLTVHSASQEILHILWNLSPYPESGSTLQAQNLLSWTEFYFTQNYSCEAIRLNKYNSG
jgi:hypothetical protein